MNLFFKAEPSVKYFFLLISLAAMAILKLVEGREGLMLETLENYGDFSMSALLNSKTYKRESKIY